MIPSSVFAHYQILKSTVDTRGHMQRIGTHSVGLLLECDTPLAHPQKNGSHSPGPHNDIEMARPVEGHSCTLLEEHNCTLVQNTQDRDMKEALFLYRCSDRGSRSHLGALVRSPNMDGHDAPVVGPDRMHPSQQSFHKHMKEGVEDVHGAEVPLEIQKPLFCKGWGGPCISGQGPVNEALIHPKHSSGLHEVNEALVQLKPAV